MIHSLFILAAANLAYALTGTGSSAGYTNGTGPYQSSTVISSSTTSTSSTLLPQTSPSTGIPTPSQNATVSTGTTLDSTTFSSTTSSGPSVGLPGPSSNATSIQPTTTSVITSSASAGIPNSSNGTSTGGPSTQPSSTNTSPSTGASSGFTLPTTNATTIGGTGTSGSGPQTTSDLVIGNTTIYPGSAPYVSGTKTYSLDSSGSLEVNGSPTSLPSSIPSTVYPSGTFVSDPSITSTMTTVPPGVSTEIITDQPSLTENTWITTTGSDSSTTILPVIVPCIGCAPIIVWDVPPIPDVIFEWPKFPKLPEFHLPCIKIFGITVAGDCDSPPENDSDPPESSDPEDPEPTTTNSETSSSSSSSSSSCTESQTASDCRVLCQTKTTLIASSASASETCSTTCFKTTTGCSVTGETTTTTVSSNSTSTSSDYSIDCTYAPPAGGTLPAAETAAATACPVSCLLPAKRSALVYPTPTPSTAVPGHAVVAGRVKYLQKRVGATTLPQLGNCKLTATPPATPVTLPAYPGGVVISASDAAGQLQGASDNIARWVTSVQEGCKPVITTIGIAEYAAANDPSGPSMDHAYEKNWLIQFFTYLTGSGGVDCPTFDNYFFNAPDQTSSVNRLEAVFNAVASNDNIGDFVAMNQDFNGLYKGFVCNIDELMSISKNGLTNAKRRAANPKMPWTKITNDLGQNLDILEKIYLGVQITNYSPTMDRLRSTYLRIYGAFQDVDASISCAYPDNGDSGLAQKFSDYMNNVFFEKNKGISDRTSAFARQILKITADNLDVLRTKYSALPDGDPNKGTYETQLNDIGSRYNTVNAYGNPSDAEDGSWRILFDSSTGSSKKKRQACSLPNTSSAGGQSTTAAPGSVVTVITPSGTGSPYTTTIAGNATTTSSIYTPYCINYAVPTDGVDYCTCTDGNQYEPASTGAVCPTASPGPSSRLITTSTTSSITSAWTSTTTDPIGDVIACTSWSTLTNGVQGSLCVGSTISTIAPSTTSNEPATTITPTSTPTAKFQIMFDLEGYEGFTGTQWYVYAKDYDQTTEVCDDSIDVLDGPDDVDPTQGDSIPFPDFPDGIDIRSDVEGYKNCKYVGSADAPGELECDGLNVICFEEQYNGDPLGCNYIDGSTDSIYPKVMCTWGGT